MRVTAITSSSSVALKRLWPELTVEDISVFADHIEVAEYAKDEVIFREGMANELFFIILEGSADIYKNVERSSADDHGSPHRADRVKLITLMPGDVAGESSLYENEPLNATLVAASEPTRVLRLSIPIFRSVLATNESINRAIFKSLSKELRKFRTSLGLALRTADSSEINMCVFDFKPHEATSFEHAVEHFRQTHTINVRYLSVKLNEETVSLAADAQIVCIFVNDVANVDVVTRLSAMGVKCIALRCAGFNNVDLKVARALGVQVVRVPAYSPYAVAEHAVALIMSLNRKIVHAHSRVKQGNFSLTNLVGFDLHGKTVGVIGTGKIGVCFIKIMLGFGCKVLCYDVYRSDEVSALPNTRYVDSIDELYEKSRVISLHCPLLPTTKYIINAESIAKMQRGVMIINTSRGPLINTKDLIAALKSGQVGSAGLDVYEEESAYFFEDLSDRVMADDMLARLLSFNNVIITSHQAFLTEEALQAIAETTMANVGEILQSKKGTELTNGVN